MNDYRPFELPLPIPIGRLLLRSDLLEGQRDGFCHAIYGGSSGEWVTASGEWVTASGEWVTASGEWVNDRTHGQQFKSRFMRTSAPTSIEGIEKYLGSGMIRGIGPVYANKMVKAFGEKVFDVIEAEPDRLREVTGIGPMRAKRIIGAWAEQKIVREIMVFLHSHGVEELRALGYEGASSRPAGERTPRPAPSAQR